jgi:hypothetical protein
MIKNAMVKDYRAALTRNLLSKIVTTNVEDNNFCRPSTNILVFSYMIDRAYILR